MQRGTGVFDVRRPRLLAVATLLGACMGLGSAHAQGQFAPSRVEGIEITRDPASTVVLSNPKFLSSASLCGLWNQNRPQLEQVVQALAGSLNSSGKLPKGVTIVRQQARLSSGCSATVSYVPRAININFKLPRNTFLFNVTTPSVGGIGAGQYADPRFSVDFDLEATAQISLPSTIGQGLTIGPAIVAVFNVKRDSQNFTGDIALAALEVVKLFSGRDLTAELTKDRVFRFDGIKADLGRLGFALGGLRDAPKVLENYDPSRQIVSLYASATGTPPADNRCISGYVWRTIKPNDLVCVTPAVRDQVRADNKLAGERRELVLVSRLCTVEPGACKSEKPRCKPGFVWREAVPDDYVCVPPATRQQARDDNAMAARRRLDYAPVVR